MRKALIRRLRFFACKNTISRFEYSVPKLNESGAKVSKMETVRKVEKIDDLASGTRSEFIRKYA
jgi:hypothetical protein